MWIKDIYNNTEYNIYVIESRRMVVATTKYEGKKVRAVSKCHPEDTFDADIGVKLAILRCDTKVRKMRRRRLQTLLKQLTHNLAAQAKALYDTDKKYNEILDEYIFTGADIVKNVLSIKDILEAKDVGNE